jgi:hypothetical protein
MDYGTRFLGHILRIDLYFYDSISGAVRKRDESKKKPVSATLLLRGSAPPKWG